MQGTPHISALDARIVILGAGSIGVAFAAVFSQAGAEVVVVDPDPDRRAAFSAALVRQHAAIASAGLEHGRPGPVDVYKTPDAHLTSAAMILECGPENLDIKREIFADLLRKADDNTVLATASSAITMSRIVPEVALQSRCLVAHPVNPPSVLRVVELVPAPGTDARSMDTAAGLFDRAGFHSVLLGHEIEGFVLNRLQGAVLREAYRLVEDGVTDVAGIDTIMRMGLGPRWALSGPFETAELNTPGGIIVHAARMGPAYKRMGEARGETVEWSADLIDRVAAQRRALLAEDDIPARVDWRARAVAALVAKRDALMDDADDD